MTGRPDKGISARENRLHHALTIAHFLNFHPVSYQRGNSLSPKLSPGTAGHNLMASVHIIEAAEGFLNPPLSHNRGQS